MNLIIPEIFHYLSVHQYQVELYTGEEEKAGTEANVYLQLFGERGDSGPRKLLKANNNNKDMFKPGQVSLTCTTGSFIVLVREETLVPGNSLRPTITTKTCFKTRTGKSYM